jgi:hypothetical protein
MRLKAVYCLLVFLVGCAQVPRPSTYPYSFQQQMQAAHHWHVLASQVVEELTARVRAGYVYSTEAVYIQNHDISPSGQVFSGLSPFGQAFRGFLISELTKQGIPVSRWREPSQEPCAPANNRADSRVRGYLHDRLKICWDVQLVVHQADRIKPSLPLEHMLLAGLGLGLAEAWDQLGSEAAGAVTAFSVGPLLDVWHGVRTGPLPHSEAIITTRITQTEILLSHNSIAERERMLSHQSNVFYLNDRDQAHYQVAGDPLVQKSYAVVDR